MKHSKEEKSEAQVDVLKRILKITVESVSTCKAEREESISTDDQKEMYIATIEHTLSDENIQRAMKAVIRNKGAAGIDGITTIEIESYMQKEWRRIKREILEGKYHPKPVKKVEIPKADGRGVRKLGIPTILDRIIQQAISQEISPIFERSFSENSYGFRPHRNAHQAVKRAQEYLQHGYTWVVDIDLEQFFDRVNHDMLMAKVARKIKDKKILFLIRKFLQAGIMEKGLVKASKEGTPQGSPLSPLLSNIFLDDFDKELEKRKLCFARYADDSNIYVKSEKAAHRVMESLTRFLMKVLKLKVNQEKSAVDRPWNRKFLGFTFTQGEEPNRIKIHEKPIKRFKDKVRESIKKMRGQNISESIKKYLNPLITGWYHYFKITEAKTVFKGLDGWIRRKLRGVLWRQWKKPRRKIAVLMNLGIGEASARRLAYSRKGPWRIARSYEMHKALSNTIMELIGYKSMEKMALASK